MFARWIKNYWKGSGRSQSKYYPGTCPEGPIETVKYFRFSHCSIHHSVANLYTTNVPHTYAIITGKTGVDISGLQIHIIIIFINCSWVVTR